MDSTLDTIPDRTHTKAAGALLNNSNGEQEDTARSSTAHRMYDDIRPLALQQQPLDANELPHSTLPILRST